MLSPICPRASAAERRTQSWRSPKALINSGTAVLSPIRPRTSAAESRTEASRSPKALSNSSTAVLSPICPRACAAELRTSSSRSPKTLSNSGTAVLSPICPKAPAAELRTEALRSPKTFNKLGTAALSPARPKTSIAIWRTRSSRSCNTFNSSGKGVLAIICSRACSTCSSKSRLRSLPILTASNWTLRTESFNAFDNSISESFAGSFPSPLMTVSLTWMLEFSRAACSSGTTSGMATRPNPSIAASRIHRFCSWANDANV